MHDDEIRKLFDQHAGALALFARRWCRMPEDAVQAAFIDLAKQRKWPNHGLAWLYRTTKRKALNLARSERRRSHHTEAAAENISDWFERRSDHHAIDGDELRSALQVLSERDYELVVAKVWGNLGFEALAEMSDCSVSTAFRRYTAALKKLKDALEEST